MLASFVVGGLLAFVYLLVGRYKRYNWYLAVSCFSFLYRAPHSLAEWGAGGHFIRQDQWDLAPATRLLAAGRHCVVSLEIGCCHRRNNPVPLMYIYTAFAKWTFCLELKAKKNKAIKWDGKNRVATNTFILL